MLDRLRALGGSLANAFLLAGTSAPAAADTGQAKAIAPAEHPIAAGPAILPRFPGLTAPEVMQPLGLLSLDKPSLWSSCISSVLVSEGGFVNNPADPGGATNRGITLAALSEWRGRACSVAEVKALAEQEAREIYRARYWNPIQGDALPAGLGLALFDFAVNSGISRAVKTLQACMGFSTRDCDGVLGPATLRAILARPPAKLISALCDARLAFMRSLRTWATFGRGWSNRVAKVLKEALAQASAAAAMA
ncbi:hypothetical protein MHL39_10800 [Roseomonas mucosa]|uniref:glycoside hydrolase family 108 protein n=1 Tax=Roseomonas mucosa TaxID=207340 RepID=UPI001EF6A091|nr:glycosyl hydrolase 108 family protein [Roseomonas mucosa]MCG7357127.1 hypothetical protein [Roseomonas mucosa]